MTLVTLIPAISPYAVYSIGGAGHLSHEVKAAVAAFFEAKQAALDQGLLPGDTGFPVPSDLVAQAAAGGLKLTIFHWGTIAWAGFVGMFIARISRGRTIREFMLGVMFIPSVVSLVWFGVLGSAGIHEAIYGADMVVYNTAVNNWDYAGALPFTFVLLAMMVGLLKSLREDGETVIENEELIRKMIEREVADLS